MADLIFQLFDGDQTTKHSERRRHLFSPRFGHRKDTACSEELCIHSRQDMCALYLGTQEFLSLEQDGTGKASAGQGE